MSSFELLDQKRCVVVFPNCIRPFFLYDRSLLGGLARCAFRTVQQLSGRRAAERTRRADWGCLLAKVFEIDPFNCPPVGACPA